MTDVSLVKKIMALENTCQQLANYLAILEKQLASIKSSQ
jgi:hypothetical protein